MFLLHQFTKKIRLKLYLPYVSFFYEKKKKIISFTILHVTLKKSGKQLVIDAKCMIHVFKMPLTHLQPNLLATKSENFGGSSNL